MNRKLITILVSLALLALTPGAAQGAFGISDFEVSLQDSSGEPLLDAGAHPDFTTEIALNKVIDSESGDEGPDGNARNIEVTLPPGFIGDPTQVPTCSLAGLVGSGPAAECDPEAQVGIVTVTNYVSGFSAESTLPVYNIDPPVGVGGQFAFNFLNVLVFINSGVTNDGRYTLTSKISEISQGLAIGDTKLTLWGVPADSSHDLWRVEKGGFNLPSPEPVPSTAPRKPMLSNPTACPGTPLTFTVRANSWQDPTYDEAGVDTDGEGNPLVIDDCAAVPFDAAIEAEPTSNEASSPTGLDLTITVPQSEDPDQPATALLRDAIVTFPEGMGVNAASAGGQETCSEAQVKLDSEAAAECPDASKIGTVRIDSPLLENPLLGEAYLAEQAQNKFGSLLAVYFTVDDPQSGTVLKLAGKVEPDPQTGRLTVTFPDNPPLPFERMEVHMFDGPRASLMTPPTCGTHTTTGEFRPYTGNAPVVASDSFAVTSGPGGGACPNGAFAPGLQAGTMDLIAGEHSPFLLRLTRPAGMPALQTVDVSLPSGLLARLAGTPYCPDAVLAGIPAAAGTGAGQLASPSCPVASRVGSVAVTAGVGSSPFPLETGSAYLAGPYKGAPLSLAFVTPALAGPFDLGNVVVRAALHVDPATARVRAVSDPLPTLLHGIPLELGEVRVLLDKPGFTLNPTSCAPKLIDAEIGSAAGSTAALAKPFQVTRCRGLGFEPRLSLRLKGGTKRGKYPALTATLRMRGGEANIRRASVALPRSEFLAQEHIRTICTRVQWAEDRCPKASIYGRAEAVTPLLDEPLRGPVYLRSSDNQLPDLVADLEGQIDIELVGRIDSFKRGIRTTFESVPDAPVSRFVLRMRGGSKGLLVNSRNICRGKHRATVEMDAQNGRGHDFEPVVKPRCGKKLRRSGKKSR
ncbi:MAG TPA: hypothetical protein VFY69_10820 [Solirubrobacterales bacterium]|nr:hypothetical protein [Solirubrobacterales bacterium]